MLLPFHQLPFQIIVSLDLFFSCTLVSNGEATVINTKILCLSRITMSGLLNFSSLFASIWKSAIPLPDHIPPLTLNCAYTIFLCRKDRRTYIIFNVPLCSLHVSIHCTVYKRVVYALIRYVLRPLNVPRKVCKKCWLLSCLGGVEMI